MSFQPVIRTCNLSYRYNKYTATLQDINMHLSEGSIYGFLGPNGSGKTTTLSLLLGLLRNQNGSIEIFGKELQTNKTDILKKVGSLIESPSLYGHLTAKENLEVYRGIYDLPKERIGEALKMAGLHDSGSIVVKKFSLGMKQRLAVALTLLHRPRILILDEPANGLDPAGIIELRELIKALNKEEGTTILFSSHILAEVEKMVHDVGIIYKGRLLFQGSLQELHQLQNRQAQVLINTSDNKAARNLLHGFEVTEDDDLLCVSVKEPSQAACINKMLAANNIDVYLLQPKANGLEQLFIQLTSSLS